MNDIKYNALKKTTLLSSDGVGHTETFIVIDTEVQRIRQESVVDVYNIIVYMR